MNSGIFNKGNTCYLNASLQCCSTMVDFWSNLTMFSSSVSPFVSSFVKIMSLLKSSKKPIDPSNFLRNLQNAAIKSGKTDFNVFQQQDAAEVLTCILNELFSVGVSAQNMINVSIKVTITCQKCDQDNVKEDVSSVLQVPVKGNIQSSLNVFLAPDILNEENLFYCHVCKSHEPALVTHQFTSLGKFLIMQTKRFISSGSRFVKHLQKIICTPNLSIPLFNNGQNETINFKLLGTINHTGSLERGHYTAYIKMPHKNKWLHCNDTAVIPTNEENLNNESSYLYFYEKV